MPKPRSKQARLSSSTKVKVKAKAPAHKAAARAKKRATKVPATAPRHIPDGYHTVTPYMVIRQAAKAIDFYVRAFGATELYRLPAPGGMIGHAELQLGTSRFMLADEMPEWGSKSPLALGGTPTGLCLYVKDCDALFRQAVAAGATVLRPLADQFYGDRSGQVLDPFGHQWTIATHVEDVSPDEMMRRMEAQQDLPADDGAQGATQAPATA